MAVVVVRMSLFAWLCSVHFVFLHFCFCPAEEIGFDYGHEVLRHPRTESLFPWSGVLLSGPGEGVLCSYHLWKGSNPFRLLSDADTFLFE